MSAIHKMRGGGFSFELTDTDTLQNNKDNPTFSAMDAGAPNGGRVLIAAIVCEDDDFDDDTFWPATCTIGGVTADLVVESSIGFPSDSLGSAIYAAVVPTGTTVDVQVTITFGGTMDDWACALFRATGVSKVALDTDKTAVGVLTFNTAGGKFVIFGAGDRAIGPTLWSGGGNPQTAVAHGQIIIGYDDAPLGGATDNYDTTIDNDSMSGAVFG